MGRGKIRYVVKMKDFPSDTQKKENYVELYAPIWAKRPELKQDALNAIFASYAIEYNPLTRFLSKFPKLVLQDGYEWEWHENGNTMCDQLELCRMVERVTITTDKKPVAMHIKGEYGIYRIWADTIQLEMFKKFAEMKEHMLLFGFPCNILDANGQPVRSVTGIQGKLKNSNIEHYNNLTPQTLLDFIMDALAGNQNPKVHRNIV